jgi:hypothetical protein
MKKNDEQFESFLREFEPREPRPLPVTASDATWRRRLLAAAVVLLAGSGSLWLAMRRTSETKSPTTQNAPVPRPDATPAIPKLSLLALTRMAQDDPQKFDATLDAESRTILPGFQGKGSALAPLAKE